MNRFPRHVLLALVFAFMLAGCAQPYTFRGVEITPAKPAPDFTLVAQNGDPFTLSQERGNVVLLFFGFTSCPDVCPTTLADIASAREQLGEEGQNVRVALISVDPERDTPQAIGKYVANYDPSFIGLTGTPAELEPVYQAYGVTAIKAELPGSNLGYTVDHSAYIYVIDKAGNWRAILPFGVTPDDIASDTRHVLRTS